MVNRLDNVIFIKGYRLSEYGFMKIIILIILLFSTPVVESMNIDKTLVISDTEMWSPAWSLDGNAIAYVAYDSNRNHQIFIINIHDKEKRQVTYDDNKKWGVDNRGHYLYLI